MMPRIVAIEERREQSAFVRCDCCNTPVAEVRGGCLIIRSRHDGEKHVTVLTLARLRELLERAAA